MQAEWEQQLTHYTAQYYTALYCTVRGRTVWTGRQAVHGLDLLAQVEDQLSAAAAPHLIVRDPKKNKINKTN
jgi:hypothetical protein